MRNIILITGLILLICGLVTAQEFAPVVMNPFGLIQADPDNSAFHVRYADMDDDDDLDAVHFGIIEDTFYISIQSNIGSPTAPNFGPHERTDLLNTYDFVLLLPDMGDINQDGLIDILAFGAVDTVAGYNCVFFKNTSTGGNLSFERTRGDAIGLPAIGDGIFIPELVDLNLDGDLDVLMSGLLNEVGEDDTDGYIYYGQNLGNSNEPAYAGWYEGAYGLSTQDTFQFAVSTAGDLDSDGDVDILSLIAVTDEVFSFYYFENDAITGERPSYMAPLISPFNLVDSFGLPDLVDIDADGDLDLFIYMGENGVAFFENISCVADVLQLDQTICDGETFQVGAETFNSPGNYQVILSNVAGCDSIINLALTVTTVNSTISLTGTTLSAENTNADAYQWIDCADNMPIPNATASTFTPTATGNYAVIITNENCIEQSDCMMVVISSTHEISALGIVMYPNPADDNLIFRGIENYVVDQLSFINALGKTYTFNLEQQRVDVSSLPAGIYMIQLQVANQIYVSRISIY